MSEINFCAVAHTIDLFDLKCYNFRKGLNYGQNER